MCVVCAGYMFTLPYLMTGVKHTCECTCRMSAVYCVWCVHGVCAACMCGRVAHVLWVAAWKTMVAPLCCTPWLGSSSVLWAVAPLLFSGGAMPAGHLDWSSWLHGLRASHCLFHIAGNFHLLARAVLAGRSFQVKPWKLGSQICSFPGPHGWRQGLYFGLGLSLGLWTSSALWSEMSMCTMHVCVRRLSLWGPGEGVGPQQLFPRTWAPNVHH